MEKSMETEEARYNLTDEERNEVAGITQEVITRICIVADKHNIDRDSMFKYFADLLVGIAEVATIRNYNCSSSVDKVVAALQSKSFERYGNQGMGGELVINLDDAVEIVKRGGVDELYKWMFKKIYFRICNIEQGFFTAGYTDRSNDCIRLENLLNKYKEYIIY